MWSNLSDQLIEPLNRILKPELIKPTEPSNSNLILPLSKFLNCADSLSQIRISGDDMLRTKRGGDEEGASSGDSGRGSLGGEELMRMSALASLSNDSLSGGNVDPRLLDDLQDLLPLLESFLDRKASNGFTRKGKIVYTKTPTKGSVLKKTGRRISESIPTRGRSILDESDREDGCSDSSSTLAQQALEAENAREEISSLNNQLEDLRQKLLEKEELVSAAKISTNQLTSIQEELKQVQHQLQEKNSLLSGFESQVSDAKKKLAERQSVLEKIQWEATMSNNQVEKLQKELKTAELEMSAFNILIEALKDDTAAEGKINDTIPHQDEVDEMDMQKLEEARTAYISAVAAAKEYQDDESLVAVASARFYLQSLVMSA